MAKHIALVPFETIDKIELYMNTKKKTMKQIKKETNCDYILNAGIFIGNKPLCNVKSNGRVYNNPNWKEFGYSWDDKNNFEMEVIPTNKKNYIGCVPLKRYEGDNTLTYPNDMGGKRGRAAIGKVGSSLLLYCSSDNKSSGSTPENLKKELIEGYKVESALMLDGGGSAQCIFPKGSIYSDRIVNNFILVYLKKQVQSPDESKGEEKVATYKVVLDPGHGNQSNNKSPDGAFSEPEFALDMANRMKAILERHNVQVTLTRNTSDNPTKKADTNDLKYRVNIANNIKDLNLFVSLHTNAVGTAWNDASGWSIYTSSANVNAGRNKAANAIISQIRFYGIETRATALLHERFYVLVNTVAPAVLIEHAFHTNKSDVEKLGNEGYRKNLAIAQSRGILDYLGIKYDGKEIPGSYGEENKTDNTDNTVSDWAKEAWEKAIKKGIADGTDPKGTVTREMVCVMLDRLGLI